MSYHTGKMGVAAGISLVFLITFPYIFLTTPAQTVAIGAGLAWLIPLISGGPPIVMILGMLYAMKMFPGDLYTVCRKLIGRVGAWAVAVYYITMFFFDGVLLLRQFAENTLLTALPSIEFSLVIAIYIAVAGLLCYAGIEAIVRANYIIMPFGIFGLTLVLLLLAPFYNIYNILPWQGTGLENVIPAGFLFAGAQVGIFALVILAPSFQDKRTVRTAAIFGVGMSAVLKSMTVLVFSLVFNTVVAKEKVLPFFEMARLVYLSRYLQRIEALFIILWVILGVMAIAINFYMGLYLITRLLKLPTMRPLIPITGIILAETAMIPPDITTVIVLDELIITTYFNVGVYVIPTMLIIAALLKKKKRGATQCAG